MKKLLLFFIVVTNLFSAGLAVKGNYRFRGNTFRNLHMNSKAGDKYRNYMDHRFRLNAVFLANDLLVIKSDIDFMGNCSNYPGSSFGCIFGDPYEPGNITMSNNPSNNVLFDRWVDDGSSVGGLEMINAKRLWAELNTGYGLLSLGRQPDHWGAGIFANSGDSVWSNYGDTLDRIVYDLKFGSVLFSPYYGVFNDRNIDSTQDFYEMGFKLKYFMVDTRNTYGFYLSLRGSRDNDNRLSTYDLYANHDFGPVNLFMEIVFQNGSTIESGIDSNGLLVRVDGDVSKGLNMSFELGWASGDKSDEQDYGTFSFNPDYRPALIMFAHESGQAPYRLTATRSGVTYSYPSSVSDAIYVKPRLSFKGGASTYDLSFIWGQTDSSSDKYGYELDFTYSYESSENLILAFDAGFLLPGDKFNTTSNQDPSYVLAGGLRLGIKF